MEKPHERARAVARAVLRKAMLRKVMLRKVMLRVGPFDDLQWRVKIEIS
jgi:hypothetical protein